MKCERHEWKGITPNDFSLGQLTFIEGDKIPGIEGKVPGTSIKRRVALCRDCYEAFRRTVPIDRTSK